MESADSENIDSENIDSEDLDSKFNFLWTMIANQAKSSRLLLKLTDLKQLREYYERALAIGPIIDPTTYKNMNQDVVQERGKLLNATIKYLEVIEEIYQSELKGVQNGTRKI
jgi:hypothetical protein